MRTDADHVDQMLLQIWRSSPVVLPFQTRAEATTIRHRLYSLRKFLQKSDDPSHRAIWAEIQRHKISQLEMGDGTWQLQISNYTLVLNKVLDDAGIGLPEPPPLEDD